MMDKKSYLEKINAESSSVKAALVVNKKILIRLVIFEICTILYLIITCITKNNGSHDIQTQFINSFINIIMMISFIIMVLGNLIYILMLVSKKIRDWIDFLQFKIKKSIFFILDWLCLFPVCAIIATICFGFLFTFAEVNGESMYPTIKNESTVFLSYLEPVERFDIVVAYITVEDNVVEELSLYQQNKYPEYYIKRVIGIPGDSVTWIDGILKINDQIVDETYFDTMTIEQHINTWNISNGFFGEFKYKKDGVTYDNCYVIPDGYYFVMGDHRDNSIDSRKIGLIPEKNIEGVVKFFFEKKIKNGD